MDRGGSPTRGVAGPATNALPPGGLAGDWTWRGWHWGVLAAAAALRIAYALTQQGEQIFGGWDGREYHAYAQSLLAGRGDDYPRFFNCLRAPGYPLFLVPFVALDAEALRPLQFAQAMLGAWQAWLLGLIAAHWAGQRAGNWALVLAAFNPFLIYYCAFVLTECVFITALWAGMALLQRLANPAQAGQRRRIIAGGLALGYACLVRPALQPFLVVAVSWIGWLAFRRAGWRTALANMAVFAAAASALTLPWMLRNRAVHGEFTLAPGGAALVFAQGNSMDYLQSYEARTKDEYYAALGRMHRRFSLHGGETPEQWAAAAREFREQHRGAWWRLQGHKLAHFWTPWVNPLIFPRAQFAASLLTMTPLFVLAAWEIARRLRRQPDAFLALLLGLVGVGWLVGGILFHVQVRYRIPFVDVSFLVVSAACLGRWRRLSKS